MILSLWFKTTPFLPLISQLSIFELCFFVVTSLSFVSFSVKQKRSLFFLFFCLLGCGLSFFYHFHLQKMGLAHFPMQAEGVLPLIVLNTIMSVVLLKNMLRSVLEVLGANVGYASVEDTSHIEGYPSTMPENARSRRISVTLFKSLQRSNAGRSNRSCGATMECCVCLSRFQGDDEISELSCKHFFHKDCLEKWFHNQHATCPLCRSVE